MIENALIDYLTIFFVMLLAIGLIIVRIFTSKIFRVSGYQPTIDTMNHEPPNDEYEYIITDSAIEFVELNMYKAPKYPAINFKK